MGQRKRKLTSGEATTFLSRKQALKKLQVSLPLFKRLCILKGIYPQEPKNRKKVGRGSTEPKVYYHVKDVAAMAREPLLETLRQTRAYMAKVKKAREKGDYSRVRHLKSNKPRYHIVDLVKERYPSKEDALRDLTDGLNLICLFSRMPKLNQVNPGLIGLSRRLAVEFLNYVIYKRALRKAFISIKGYYLTAEIDDIEVTWIMPHNLGCHIPTEVDLRTLATCLEFDTTMIGCLMKRLYQEAALTYPPTLKRNVEEDFFDEDYCTHREVQFEFVSALSYPLKSLEEEADDENDTNLEELQAMDENFSVAMERRQKVRQQQRLFEGKRFFLNREVPREVLCFLVRSCGGEASWDRVSGPGATYGEEDTAVNYQVVDRPRMPEEKLRINRFYVQPQWVFDCVNAGRLLNPQDYLQGVDLPAHLSPYALEKEDGYQPPEADYMRGNVTLAEVRAAAAAESSGEESSSAGEEEVESIGDEVESLPEEEEEESAPKRRRKKAQVQVLPGKPETAQTKARREEVAKNAERKLRELCLPKKHKNVYKKMVFSVKRKAKDLAKMTQKRENIDRENRSAKKRKIK